MVSNIITYQKKQLTQEDWQTNFTVTLLAINGRCSFKMALANKWPVAVWCGSCCASEWLCAVVSCTGAICELNAWLMKIRGGDLHNLVMTLCRANICYHISIQWCQNFMPSSHQFASGNFGSQGPILDLSIYANRMPKELVNYRACDEDALFSSFVDEYNKLICTHLYEWVNTTERWCVRGQRKLMDLLHSERYSPVIHKVLLLSHYN